MAVPLGSTPHRAIAVAWMCVPGVIGSEAKLRKIPSRLSGLLVMAASLAGATPSLTTAADLASIYYAAPVRYVALNLVGPHVGATLGYEWGCIDNNPMTAMGLATGLQATDWGDESFVYGGETDVGPSAADNTFAPWQFSNPWFGTALNSAQHWSTNAEWLYFELDDRRLSLVAANNGLAANLVRLGLNYRF
jgi:hypothetical protein